MAQGVGVISRCAFKKALTWQLLKQNKQLAVV